MSHARSEEYICPLLQAGFLPSDLHAGVSLHSDGVHYLEFGGSKRPPDSRQGVD